MPCCNAYETANALPSRASCPFSEHGCSWIPLWSTPLLRPLVSSPALSRCSSTAILRGVSQGRRPNSLAMAHPTTPAPTMQMSYVFILVGFLASSHKSRERWSGPFSEDIPRTTKAPSEIIDSRLNRDSSQPGAYSLIEGYGNYPEGGARLQNLGISLEIRSALLGHSTKAVMTSQYSHGGQGWNLKLRDAVAQLETTYNTGPATSNLSYGAFQSVPHDVRKVANSSEDQGKGWWSQRDLNPCLSLERAPS